MHYGSADTCDPLLDPHVFDDHLEDIRDGYRVNQLCFFLVSLRCLESSITGEGSSL